MRLFCGTAADRRLQSPFANRPESGLRKAFHPFFYQQEFSMRQFFIIAVLCSTLASCVTPSEPDDRFPSLVLNGGGTL
jgi:hypothetical protein